MEASKMQHEATVANLNRKVEETQKNLDEVEGERMRGLPVDVAVEIKKYKEKLVG